MRPSASGHLYLGALLLYWGIQAVVTRVAQLLAVGVVLAAIGVGYLYAATLMHIKELLGPFSPTRRFKRTL